MKTSIAFWTIILGFALNASAQTIPYNGPESLVQNAQEQYASIILPTNVSVTWSITGGVILGSKTNALVQFNAGGVGNLVLTAQLSNGSSVQKTIPVRQAGATLFQGATVNFTAGVRQHPIYQLLRGERIFISSQVSSGAKPILSLLDFQGRLILQDDTLDYKTTVRGSYLVVVDAKTSGSLVVQGVRPAQAGSSGVPINSPLTLDAATQGKLDKEIDRSTRLTGGEGLIRNGNTLVSAYYDVNIRKTLIKGYQNDQLIWTWTSAEHEYIRTLNTGNNGEILAIGSSGEVGAGLDNVLVIRLQSNGNFIARVEFGTAGYDFGYGIAAFSDNSLLATGFTTGSFSGFSNKGGFDAFAVKISPTNTVSSLFQFGSNQDDRVFACKTLKNGNVLVFGDTEGDLGNNSNSAGEFDLFLTELTPTLVQNWTELYGSAENDLAFDLVIDPGSGDAFLTGMTTGILEANVGNPTSPQVYLMRINVTSKAIAWVHQMGPDEGQSSETLALSDKGVGVLFYTNGSFPGLINNSLGSRASDDMVVAHFDFNGKLEWLKQFNQTAERIFARGIAFADNTCFVLQDHIYVPDAVFSTTSLDRFVVPTISVAARDLSPTSMQVYPNPFVDKIWVKNVDPDATFQLYDGTGRLVFSGKNVQEQDFAKLPSGFYALSIRKSTTPIFTTFKLIKP